MTLPSLDTLSSYGGALNNYGTGVVDPTTDRDAAAANQAYATIAMASRMVPRCEVAFTGSSTSPALASWEAVWRQATGTAPTIGRTGVGIYTITWPTTVNDELTVSHTLNLQRSHGQAEGAASYRVQCQATSPNVITVWTFNSSGTLVDPTGVTIVVWAR